SQRAGRTAAVRDELRDVRAQMTRGVLLYGLGASIPWLLIAKRLFLQLGICGGAAQLFYGANWRLIQVSLYADDVALFIKPTADDLYYPYQYLNWALRRVANKRTVVEGLTDMAWVHDLR
ncbi:hypothetical protein ACJX0J_034759, partial [Zea mays]